MVVCSKCLAMFRLPPYGIARFSVRRGLRTSRYDLLRGIHSN
jgi:hypothetical protein